MSEIQLLLLRHGEVASHRGGVPVTEAGLVHAERTGKAIGARSDAPTSVLFGGTRRTLETAEAIVRCFSDPERVAGPTDTFAQRNPDSYLAGTRGDMVSAAEPLTEQVAGIAPGQVEANQWWSTLVNAPDRNGWWQTHDAPPWSRHRWARRIHRFARSVTHSPLLRAVLSQPAGRIRRTPYVTCALIHVG